MQRLCIFCVLVLSWSYQQTLAQNGRYEISARNAAMAGATATVSDAFSGFHNVGTLGAYEEGLTAVAGYQNRFDIKELSLFGFGVAAPMRFGTLGLMAGRFGTTDLYNEQRLGLAFGNTIDFVSLGFSVNYIQYNIETAGTRRMVSIDFGGLVEVSKNLLFGAYIRNLNQAKVQEFTDERLPTLMVLGFSYRPIEELMVNAEVEKDIDLDAQVKVGLEYSPIEQGYLRTGIKLQPFEGAFGVGFRPKRFIFDYAYITTPDLGDKHEVSIGYLITPAK
ncbi:MAG: hypothetical protein AAGC88_13810 [Bacteroidota bacterium]